MHTANKPITSLLTENKAPLEDLLVSPTDRANRTMMTVRAEHTLTMRMKLPKKTTSTNPLERTIVLFNTSTSRTLNLETNLHSLHAIVMLVFIVASMRLVPSVEVSSSGVEGASSFRSSSSGVTVVVSFQLIWFSFDSIVFFGELVLLMLA
jgi:hypothetical protein